MKLKKKINSWLLYLMVFFALVGLTQCKKIIAIDPPSNTITTPQVFSTNDQAVSAMTGVYNLMINGSSVLFARGATTVYAGASADELSFFTQSNVNNVQFQNNTLTSVNPLMSSTFWSAAYSVIYGANAVIEGVSGSSNINDSIKNELLGEAKFVRAFCTFYLVNLFGDIPIVNTTNWYMNGTQTRNGVIQVYQAILADLKDAQNSLPSNYSIGLGKRIIPNKWAATAMLARVYLYLEDWKNAEDQTAGLINNTLFKLEDSLNNVFLVNSNEAIWQLQQTNANYSLTATPEGNQIITLNGTSMPYVYLTQHLLNSFDNADQRKISWVNKTVSSGTTYYYPYKYKIGPGQKVANGPYKEFYMVLRLAEQYLIRAEARARQNNLTGAIADINVIRTRAGLPSLPNTLTQSQIMSAIEQENRIEFFAEWGHRWFDLKRWGRSDAVLGPIKGNNWQTTDKLYPIPQSELTTDPNLTQNPGY